MQIKKNKYVIKTLEEIKNKDSNSYKVIGRYLVYLETQGRNVKRPKADNVRGKIFELRPKQYRVLYAYVKNSFGEEYVEILHICEKKQDTLRENDIRTAEKRLDSL